MAAEEKMGVGMKLIRPSIPKGLRIKAQGCLSSEVLLTKEGEATLGKRKVPSSTPTGLCQRMGMGALITK